MATSCVALIVALSCYFSLCLASDEIVGKILVLNTANCSDPSYTLTSYIETEDGFPEGISRCQTNTLSSTEYYPSSDCLEDIVNFCQAAFIGNDTDNDMVTQCVGTVDGNFSTNLSSVVYSDDDGCALATSIREEYNNFEAILNRTLVGVYTKSCDSKTVCLQAYTRWLCSIRLNWTVLIPTDVNCNSSCYDDESIRKGDDYYSLVQPCLSVCHDVLQKCPYFLPSDQQSNNTLIYGGYPAFDCPRYDSLFCNNTYSEMESMCFNGSLSLTCSSSSPILVCKLSVVMMLVTLYSLLMAYVI